jgi:Zn-dependent protease
MAVAATESPARRQRGQLQLQIPDFIQNAGPELPFLLILLALLGLRHNVTPSVSLLIKAPIEKVFALVDLRDGEQQGWHRTEVTARLIDPAQRIFRMTYVTTLAAGAQQTSEADFRVVERREPHLLVLERAGIEGGAHNSELLRIVAALAPEKKGTRLNLTYHWGPRPLIAQLLARADLWGAAYRLKGVAETGRPDTRSEALISAAVAAGTGIVTLLGFSLWFGWVFALLLVAALMVHEFGHLLAFRLIGQPWGRMVFLPFLGALAVPRLPYESQGQSVFAALMGPGLSILIPIVAVAAILAGWGPAPLFMVIGIVVSALNLFNLLPVEPLDGGIALRSVLARLLGERAHYGLMAMGVLIALAGWLGEMTLLLVFGGISILANLRPRRIDHGLKPLSFLQVAITAFDYMAIVAAYAAILRFLLARLEQSV